MKVLLVEDEPYAAERLKDLLLKYDESLEIMDVKDSVEDTVSFLNEHQDIDLAFLDIQLADGKSFEIFSEIEFMVPVIFTTAFDEYALDAFKVNSIDYLLKPIKYDELVQAIEKMKKIRTSGSNQIPEPLMEALIKQEKVYKKRFLVKLGSNIQFKNCDEVALFKAEDSLCYLVENRTGRQYLIDHTLEDLEKRLLNPDNFFRISRKFIINLVSIKEIRMRGVNDCEVLISTAFDEKLSVSRNRIKNFKNWIDA